ncbi:phage tail collar family protein [Photorhabdus aegyptia]|uniref:Phage tail collar family protein n=2 Tax=Photorhabdus aegyptia TaxID=2805098 RepID=A0A022PHS8_9GAMM|nr:phage tail collar family protein [Photorhabdus aegyptia]
MSQKNDFKAFSIGNNANVISQEKYEENQNLQTGFPQDGITTDMLNKALRQSSTISSVVANFIATQSGNDVLDDGNIEKLTAQLNSALEQKMTTKVPDASLTQKGIVQLTNVIGNSDTLAVTQKLAQEIINSLREEINVPVGSPIPWPLPYPPINYLVCNGAFFNKLQYPKLAEAYPDGRLPDLRGEFIRGWDSGRNVDPSRSILSWQEGAYLVQNVDQAGNFLITPSRNELKKLQWDIPRNNNISVKAVYYKAQADWIANSAFIGISRPRNIAFNYIVRAAACSIMTEQKNFLEHETAVLGENGLAIQPGWIKVYHTNQITREFTNSDIEYVMLGVSLSAHSYLDAPDFPDSDDVAVCRSEDGKRWERVPDYRGKIAYDTLTLTQQGITELGELPETLTFKQPTTDFDKWDGTQWITDNVALKANQVEQAEQRRVTLLRHANESIALLQDAADLDIATEAEKAALLEWKKYRVMLNRVNISLAPEMEWPEQPR